MGSVNRTLKETIILSMCAAVLFVQQLALSFLPNIQLSVLLVVLYTRVFGFRKTSLIIIVHVLVTNILSPFGPVIPVFIPAMVIAWMLVPVLLTTVFRHVRSALGLALFGLFYGFVYGWVYIPFAVFLTGAPFAAYALMDIPFEILMAISNFTTILWLYDPLHRMLNRQIDLHLHTPIIGSVMDQG
jgi:energy-coupling factor transport system substrate-specific component